MSGIRGELAGYAAPYAGETGGASKMARSVDPAQIALAANSVKVATSSMTSQFGRFLTIFSDVG